MPRQMPQGSLPICQAFGIITKNQGLHIKNTLLKLLAKPYLRYRGAISNPERILVASTTGLGDTLWATPAIRALKQTYPQALICILTSPVGAQVLKNNPYIDQMVVMDSSSFLQVPKIAYSIKRFGPDQVFIFHASQRIILPLCAMTQAKSIAGTYGMNKGLDKLLTESCTPTHQHEISRRMQIAGLSGSQTLDWHTSIEETSWAQEFIKRFTRPVIALHPGSKDRFKQWPKEHFIKLGQKCASELTTQVVVTGNLEEKPLANQIAKSISGGISLAGELSIRQLGALLPLFKCFVTNDTGPMHMAFATNTKTVALFGPTDPSLCGPHHAKQANIIAKKKTCSPCLRKKCCDPFCMRSIGVQEVFLQCVN